MSKFTYQTILNGAIGTDTFFVMSGFLTAYYFISDMKKTNNKLTIKKVINHFVHRLVRIFPMSAAIVAIYATFLRRIRQGPISFEQEIVMRDIHVCEKYGWRNLVFINNFFPMTECVSIFNCFFDHFLHFCLIQCGGFTWYLSVDMQFYIVGAFGLFLYPLFVFYFFLIDGDIYIHFFLIRSPIFSIAVYLLMIACHFVSQGLVWRNLM